MITPFSKLTDSEVELMYKAPFLVCILIAGADGDVDRKEMRSAIEIATKKQKKANSPLVEFYRNVGEDFEDKLKIVLQSYSSLPAKRNPIIVGELSNLNAVILKIDKVFSTAFYQSMREIAMGIATSSGGLLGMNKVGSEEARYVELTMIHPPA